MNETITNIVFSIFSVLVSIPRIVWFLLIMIISLEKRHKKAAEPQPF